MENLQDEIREIRGQLRRAMNGVTSTSMREKGIVYKLNFGVSYPDIKEIARTREPSAELASALWKEDIREFKILATLLCPADTFPREEAKRWVEEIPYLEIAEHCARNLFVHLPYKEDLTLGLIYNRAPFARTVTFLVWANMFKRGETLTGPYLAVFLVESFRTVGWEGYGADVDERLSALQAMKIYGRQSESNASRILDGIKTCMEYAEDSAYLQEIYNDLKFEFEYYS